MQLKQLRQAVENELNLAPDNEVWRKRVRAVLSEEHRSVCAEEDWRFLRVNHELTVGPDVDFGSGSGPCGSITLTYSAASNQVTIDSGTLAAIGYAIGATFLDDENNQYTIANIQGANTIELSKNYLGSDTGGGSAGAIRCLSFPLPQDVDVVLAHYEKQAAATTINADGTTTTSGNGFFGDLQGGSGILRRFGEQEDEVWAYSLDETGDPKKYRVLEEDLQNYVGGVLRQDHELAGAAAAAMSGLVVGQLYRYVYCLKVGGVRGPFSNIVEVTPTGGFQHVDLSGMKAKAEGYKQEIYRATGAEGVFYKIATQDATGSTYTDTGGATNQDTVADFGLSDRFKKVQYYPRPDTVVTYRLVYRRRVEDLILPHQVPAIPEPYQDRKSVV